MKTIFKTIITALMLSFLSTANAFIIGTPNGANSFPLGSTNWLPTYQQVYGASEFSGSTAIRSLSFYHTQDNNGNTTPTTGTYTFSLSTTAQLVDGLMGNSNSNLGADNTVVFTGSLPTNAPFGGKMDIILDSIFNYDASFGNLLLTITATGTAQNNGSVFFDTSNSSTDSMSRLYRGNILDSRGLITGFNEANLSSVPAPAAFLLIGLGFVGMRFSIKLKNL